MVRRFINPNARLIFTEPSVLENVCDRFDATSINAARNQAVFCHMVEAFGLSCADFSTMTDALMTRNHRLAPHPMIEGIRLRHSTLEDQLSATDTLFDWLFAAIKESNLSAEGASA